MATFLCLLHKSPRWSSCNHDKKVNEKIRTFACGTMQGPGSKESNKKVSGELEGVTQ